MHSQPNAKMNIQTESNSYAAAAHSMISEYFIIHTTVGSTNLGNRTRIKIEGTYQDAVNMAHQIWNLLEKKTLVTVHSDEYCLHFWHWISATGEVKDRNTNSGVVHPEGYNVIWANNAYRLAAD